MPEMSPDALHAAGMCPHGNLPGKPGDPCTPESVEPARETSEQVIEQSLDEIMTFDEYRGKGTHPQPYLYELKAGKSRLSFFGSRHSVDAQDPMFPQLKEKLVGFAKQAGPRPLVFIEGGMLDTSWIDSEEQALGEGEMAYTRYLAEAEGIEVRSPEPSQKEVFESLMKEGFTKDEVVAWYLLRNVASTTKIEGRPISYSDIGRQLVDLEEQLGAGWIQDFPGREAIIAMVKTDPGAAKKYAEDVGRAAAKRFLETFKQMTGVELARREPSPEESTLDLDPVLADQYADPVFYSGPGSRTNAISAAVSRVRDIAVARVIGRELAAGRDVFVTFGGSHAFMLEPAMRRIAAELSAGDR